MKGCDDMVDKNKNLKKIGTLIFLLMLTIGLTLMFSSLYVGTKKYTGAIERYVLPELE